MTHPDPELWICVKNTEDRWSVWPAALPVPAGWQAQGAPECHADCLARVEQNWQDPRPAALKEAMT